MEEEWSSDVELLLEQIRLNSIQMSLHHKDRFLVLKSYLRFFRIPTICLSAVGIFTAVGLTGYVSNGVVSFLSCGISLVTGIINSIELYIGVQRGMELELSSSKDFYILATDIFKILTLTPENRMVAGRTFLDEKYQAYCKLIESSIIVDSTINDKLLPFDISLMTIPPAQQSPKFRRMSTVSNFFPRSSFMLGKSFKDSIPSTPRLDIHPLKLAGKENSNIV